ncbi:ubiquitin carboxyl-terminal hydrolase 1 [Phialemonium atrogriseum]|uniref:ubiquitinyl hydrolase 1 n=1 Tax=Phialemonium atrogriseum TaxID=1093897 RepID=A0AAJ0BXH9_9PEZI|nr:ubiquitin carboxyl-terminal hydrolase 1 [Phialemonium atrogriseum]KAK1766120.1 ubiquitin carboxyl-terminal hydrolase 1 [Phialemonium atrogriseum]
MNSDTKRILSQFDSYDDPGIYPGYYSSDRLIDRLFHPTVLISVVVIGLAIYYQRASQNGELRPLLELLWDRFVHIIPARLLYAIDNWLNPPLFPTPMLQTRSRTHAAKSEVLRRVLGMDGPGGIMTSMSQAGRRSLSSLAGGLSGTKGYSDTPPGLGNWDNSCYQNSILQSLVALKPLPPYLASSVAGRAQGRLNTTMVDALRDLLGDLNDESNNGKTLWTPSILKNMSTWQQQDAQEYFSKLLDEMDKEMAKAARAMQKPAGLVFDLTSDETTASQHSDDSGYQSLSNHSKAGAELRPLRNPLEGLAAQRVACTACGYSEGLSMIPFNCLTLSLGTDKNEHDLYERLDSYTKVESIPGVDCAKCTLLKFRKMINIIIERSQNAGTSEKDFPEPFARLRAIDDALEEDDFDDKTLSEGCKIPPQQRVSSTKTKQAVIARAPQSLAIHMNRSVFDESTGFMFKNPAAVRFPMTLDLGPWCLGSADRLTGHIGETAVDPVDEKVVLGAKDEEQWLLDPRVSMVAGDKHPSKITGPIYELRAVITHYGQHENGHYVCYRRHPRSSHPCGGEPPQLRSEDDWDGVNSLDGKTSFEHDGPDSDAPRQAEPQDTEEEPPSQWWRLSDQDVTVADEETVLRQGGVFMLFYDCVDPSSVVMSDEDALADTVMLHGGLVKPGVGVKEATGVSKGGGSESAHAPRSAKFAASKTATVGGDDEVLERARGAPLPLESDDDGL